MAQSPITKTMDEMLGKLREATETYRESEKAVTEYTNAIRALAQVCEDEEIKATYLLALEEITGKPGFADAVRFVLKKTPCALTAIAIKNSIILFRRMDLSVYSNPMASIHTTLRRMKERREIEEGISSSGEKTYRPIVKAPIPPAMRSSKPQERFSLADTKPSRSEKD